jgi:RNA polymerase sigma factor (sigma-70 family)
MGSFVMNSDAECSVTLFFEQLKAGDPEAAEQLWQRFSPRLLGLARKTLGNVACRNSDAEDAAQSAFVSFWKRASSGRFANGLNRDDLWNVLGVITVRKARRQLRREMTLKRGGGHVVLESSAGSDTDRPFRLDEQAAGIPVEQLDQTVEELLNALDEEPRAIVLLKLMEYTNREIAELRGCTERKVERKLQLIRRTWDELNPTD